MSHHHNLTHIIIHTDGACSGNPGPGGWGAIINYWDGDTHIERKELSSGEFETTNNRMELSAVSLSLVHVVQQEGFDLSTPITVISDSQYVVKGFSEWRHAWRRRGWRTADKKPVKNLELWKSLETAASGLSLTIQWVRGHNGDKENEAADLLAVAAIPLVPA